MYILYMTRISTPLLLLYKIHEEIQGDSNGVVQTKEISQNAKLLWQRCFKLELLLFSKCDNDGAIFCM